MFEKLFKIVIIPSFVKVSLLLLMDLINISMTSLFNLKSLLLFKMLINISFTSLYLKLNFIPLINLYIISFFSSINCTYTNNFPKMLLNSSIDALLFITLLFKKLIISNIISLSGFSSKLNILYNIFKC